MPKVKISEYSATANSNTDVASINIDEGCAPSGINNAIRAVMGHLKDFQQGTYGDPFNGPVNGTVGATTRNTGAFTTLTSNGATTFTAGTASTTTGTGTLVITGGLGVSGRINAANVDGIIGANTAAAGSFTTVSATSFLGALGNASGAGQNVTLKAGFGTAAVAGNLYLGMGRGNSSGTTGNIFFGPSGADANGLTDTYMTLDASGNLLVGGTSNAAGARLLSESASGNQLGLRYTSVATWYNSIDSSGNYIWTKDGTNIARFDSSGNLLVGTTTGSNHYIAKAVAEGADILGILSSTTNLQTAYFMGVSSAGENAAASAIGVRKNGTTSRSINAGGTINASGTDYAEYMTKAGNFTVAKGDVVGIDANGKLTNVFADSVSFMVKSTDPSYVGGDTWGSVDVLGQRPNDDATQEVKDAFYAALEAARQRVDRIAFAGQVPVNVTGATAGQYIIPVNNNGAIKGEAVSNPTFEQYQIAVGKVIAIESDGRAKIIVKVA